jgi:steroid delta-isomerase-like uncharacterized protein
MAGRGGRDETQPMSTPNATAHTVDETLRLHEQYMAAWAAHDLDAMVAFHAQDGAVFQHVAGQAEHVGPAAIREAWTTTLTTWPDITFEDVRLNAGEGLVTCELVMRGTLGVPLSLPEGEVAPGARMELEGVDVMAWRDGRLWRKDTYYDMATLVAQLLAA